MPPGRAELSAQRFRGYVGLPYRQTTARYGTDAQVDFSRYLHHTCSGACAPATTFNPPGEFGAFYVSLDPETPFRELRRAFARLADTPDVAAIAAQRVLLTIDVTLACVVDLRDADECRGWGLLPVHVTGDDWTPCQDAARHVRREHEAICYASATGLGDNLAIFADRLRSGSSLRLVKTKQLWLPER